MSTPDKVLVDFGAGLITRGEAVTAIAQLVTAENVAAIMPALPLDFIEELIRWASEWSSDNRVVLSGNLLDEEADEITRRLEIASQAIAKWGTRMSRESRESGHSKIRLLIADDHQVLRVGLRSLFAGTNIEIVGEADSGKETLKKAQKIKPDVILLDVRMPDGDGLATLEELRAKVPESKVVMLSTYDNPTYIARAVALGASDYVLKGSSRDDIIATIVATALGESPSRAGELKKIAATMKVRQLVDDDDVPLTQRETQVLRHVALGLSNREIGRSLEISVETVKEHVQNILRKIAVSDRTQAAVWAVRKGVL